MFAVVAILLPSFVGIKLMDHLLKSLKVKDIVIYYGILVLFTQGINNILVKYYYNINDTLWNSLNIGTDFFSIYILVSLIINVLITLLLVVIVKNIKFEVEVAYAKKNNVSNTKYKKDKRFSGKEDNNNFKNLFTRFKKDFKKDKNK